MSNKELDITSFLYNKTTKRVEYISTSAIEIDDKYVINEEWGVSYELHKRDVGKLKENKEGYVAYFKGAYSNILRAEFISKLEIYGINTSKIV